MTSYAQRSAEKWKGRNRHTEKKDKIITAHHICTWGWIGDWPMYSYQLHIDTYDLSETIWLKFQTGTFGPPGLGVRKDVGVADGPIR